MRPSCLQVELVLAEGRVRLVAWLKRNLTTSAKQELLSNEQHTLELPAFGHEPLQVILSVSCLHYTGAGRGQGEAGGRPEALLP